MHPADAASSRNQEYSVRQYKHMRDTVANFTSHSLGPNLPAFVTPNMLNILVENYNIKPTDVNNVGAEIENMLQGQ